MPYTELFLEMPFPCWIYDLKTMRFLSVNKSAINKYGFSEEDFIERLSLSDIRPGEDRQILSERVNKLKNKPLNSGVWRHKKKNGETFYVRIYSCPLNFQGIEARFVAAIDVNEHVEVERKARKLNYMNTKQKEQMETILSSLKEVVWSVRPDDLRVKFINTACADVYGYTAEEIMKDKRLLSSLIHPEDQLLIPALKEKLFNEGKIEVEFRMIHKDGSIKHMWNECHVLRTSSGIPYRITGASVDVTDQRLAEVALKEQHKKMDEIFESISDVFFVLDKKMNFVYLNKVFEETYQVSRNDLQGRNIWDHFKAARSYKYFSQFNKALDEQVTVEFEEYAPSIDRWLFVKAYPFSGGLAVYFRNITREKKLREQVKKDTQNMRALIDNTDDLIWSVDENYRLLSYNQAYKNWFISVSGKPPLRGADEYLEELGRVSYEKWIRYYDRALSGIAFKVVETEWVNNTARYVECSFKPIKDKDDSIWGVSCFSKDITDYRNKIHQVEMQNHKFKEIAWIQSHKVRSPVATILGLTQFINKENPADPENIILIEGIEDAAKVLDEVIHSIVLLTDELQRSENYESLMIEEEKKVVRREINLQNNMQVPSNEAKRVNALHEYGILDTLADRSLQDITKLAARLTNTPMALVCFVDVNRICFMGGASFDVNEIPRDISFSSYAILNPAEVLVIRDASKDERFNQSPIVYEDPNICFYAAAPIVTKDGYALGTLSVMDKKPGDLSIEQMESLKALADQVVVLLELRKMQRAEKAKMRLV